MATETKSMTREEAVRRAQAAEAKLKEIARTRRPTEAESREAIEAYRLARRATERADD